ncbi:phage DNA ejection protein [Lelliottia amnigena]|uniref:phage DNA ejection protein n=1 Tax=Lelliottia amnigena TaxID=61646 RepID=UPI003018C2C2
MATWQQGNSGGLLAGLGGSNVNAPQSNDANTALALIRQNNEAERAGSNNVGLQALQGIGSVMDVYQQQQKASRQKEFQQAYGNAYASGDRAAMRQLASQFPDQVEAVRNGMKFVDEDQRNTVGNLAAAARLASSSPEAMGAWLQNNAADLQRVGLNPAEVAQTYQQNPQQFGEFVDHLGMAALGPVDYFNAQDKIAGRVIDRDKLAEQVRSNQAGEALQARGQDITARGQDLSYQSSMTGHNLASQRLALDQQEFGLKLQQAQEKAKQLITEAPKLSVNMEKGIETAVNNATASSNSADSMSALAQQFRQEKPTTGLFGNANNMFSKLTGSETALRDLRIRQNAIINSQVLKYLPPGPATDRDVNIAREGAPSSWDDPEIVANWLDANARLERRNAQFNEFKSEWMSANGNPGQSRNGGQVLGMDVKKGESLGSAVKRYMADNPIDNVSAVKSTTQQSQPAQQQQQSAGFSSLWGD